MEWEFAEALAGKTVLVTGAGGLIGSAAVRRLLTVPSVRVIAAGRSPEKLREVFNGCPGAERLSFVAYDAAEPLSFEFAADRVIHAACSAHPMAYATDPVGVMKANLLGTMNLLEALRGVPGSRMVFLSTGEIYGTDPELEDGFTEAAQGYIDLLNPRSCYPESKRASETLIASYYKEYGVDARVARLCHVYGPGITASNSRADAQFLRNVLSGEPIVMKSAGSQVRSFCYVDDAVDALFTILEKGEPAQAYNVANRRSTASIRTFAETLARLGGVEIRVEAPDAVEQSGYTRVARAVLDPSRLEALGWSPRYDLEQGVAQLLKAARKHP